MRTLRTAIVALLVFSLGAPAFAGDLQSSVAKAADRTSAAKAADRTGVAKAADQTSVAKAAEQATARSERPGSFNAEIWAGTALFVGGMTVGLFSFIRNQNGQFSEFGEANAVNKPLGAVGLGAAFAGGALIFLGSRKARRAPAVTVGAGRVAVSKQIAW